jgi:hypothetical protein
LAYLVTHESTRTFTPDLPASHRQPVRTGRQKAEKPCNFLSKRVPPKSLSNPGHPSRDKPGLSRLRRPRFSLFYLQLSKTRPNPARKTPTLRRGPIRFRLRSLECRSRGSLIAPNKGPKKQSPSPPAAHRPRCEPYIGPTNPTCQLTSLKFFRAYRISRNNLKA